ncbi:hypothetical protein VCHSUH04_07320 [Veillonella sp. T14073-2]|nr:hypothetical protein VCHSUH04_07320 [Veillonella sp. T14073-2]
MWLHRGCVADVGVFFLIYIYIYIYAYLRFLRVYVYKHLFIYLLFLIKSKYLETSATNCI